MNTQPRTYIFAFFLLLLISAAGCSSESNPPEASTPTIEKPEPVAVNVDTVAEDSTIYWENESVPKTDGSASSCEDVLTAYNNWVDYYISVLKYQLNHPLDLNNLQKSARLSLQSAQWAAREIRCNADEQWQKAYKRAQQKLLEWTEKIAE